MEENFVLYTNKDFTIPELNIKYVFHLNQFFKINNQTDTQINTNVSEIQLSMINTVDKIHQQISNNEPLPITEGTNEFWISVGKGPFTLSSTDNNIGMRYIP
jgi:hypothetical protein